MQSAHDWSNMRPAAEGFAVHRSIDSAPASNLWVANTPGITVLMFVSRQINAMTSHSIGYLSIFSFTAIRNTKMCRTLVYSLNIASRKFL